ncbi:hypothetical protein ACO0K9_26125 [Undibacterium sp. Ji50W]|uniref:hypothetical protein n=1 Tax=Undibacterium sp. Ji50W TaxID=3413041 RepID=UPI003BF009BC
MLTSDPGFWRDQLGRPVLERLGVAPAEVLAYVASVNASQQAGQQHVPSQLASPEAVVLAADFLVDVQDAMAEMPPSLLTLLARPLLGVYFARGLGSSALTDVVMTPDGQQLGMVCLMDADAFLHRAANEWASWKENTPFLPQDQYRIDVVIETPDKDTRKNAIQFLLLHEFGHVLTANSEYLPDWWIGSKRFKSTEEYSYLSLSWQIAMSGDVIPLLREDFPQRKHLHFYTGEQLPGELIPEIYQSLQKTGFPTLYAATNVYDDFADGFASYVHQVMLQRPFEISIRQGEQRIMQLGDYWSGPKAKAKASVFAGMFAGA